jgi:hypothetical protein
VTEFGIPLDFAPRRLRSLTLKGLFGFIALGAWLPSIVLAWADAPEDLAFYANAGALLPMLALCLWLPRAVLRMRQPNSAKLTLDGDWLQEWDGAHVRTALRWRDATSRVEESQRGRVVQLASPAGQAITVHDGEVGPAWLQFRRTWARELSPLLGLLHNTAREAAPIQREARDLVRPVAHRAGVMVGIGIAVLGVVGTSFHSTALLFSFVELLLALAFLIPALRPLRELVELLALQNRHHSAVLARILEGDEESALVELHAGGLVRIDVRAARHPDGRLTQRKDTSLWITAPAVGWIPRPTRSSVSEVANVDRVETERDRAERARVAKAAALELTARVLGAVVWFIASSEVY